MKRPALRELATNTEGDDTARNSVAQILDQLLSEVGLNDGPTDQQSVEGMLQRGEVLWMQAVAPKLIPLSEEDGR